MEDALEKNVISHYQDGEEFIDTELALAVMLRDGVLFANSRDYLFNDKKDGHTIVLYVICNDIFAWGVADAEDLYDTDEVGVLYKMHIKDKKWGSSKWCCLKRNEQPQEPVRLSMQEDGSWDEELKALPKNHYDTIMQEKYGLSGK